MNELLTKLGVSLQVQALFNIKGDLLFDYGDGVEHYFERGHRLPSTQYLWRAGSDLAMQVILAPSVMELISFMALNAHRFPYPGNLGFLATGNNCPVDKLQWISSAYKQRKFILAYSNDLLGHLADIKVAAGIRGKTVAMAWSDPLVSFTTWNRSFYIEQQLVSLNAFERRAGTKLRVRTLKPYRFNTWLEQLKNDAK